MPRDYSKFRYYVIAIGVDSDLHRRLEQESRERNMRQVPTIIKILLERYYEIKDIRSAIESIKVATVYQQPEQATSDDTSSNVDEAMDVWPE